MTKSDASRSILIAKDARVGVMISTDLERFHCTPGRPSAQITYSSHLPRPPTSPGQQDASTPPEGDNKCNACNIDTCTGHPYGTGSVPLTSAPANGPAQLEPIRTLAWGGGAAAVAAAAAVKLQPARLGLAEFSLHHLGRI